MKKILLLFIIVLIYGCASQKPIKLTNQFIDISFGHFGGVTGLKTGYKIDNCGVISKTGLDTVILDKKLLRENLREIAEAIKISGFATLEVYDTGNMTNFIKIKNKKFSKTLFWTQDSNTPELKNLYNLLIDQLN